MFIINRFLLIFFSISLFAAENTSLDLFPNEFFISENQPTPPFEELLKHHSVNCATPTLTNIVAATQKQWMRSNSLERWDLPNIYADSTTRRLFQELKLIDAIKPENNNFDYAVVFGSTVKNMRKRLAYLLFLYNKGVKFKQIVFLVGDRKRDTIEESEEVLKNEDNHHLANKKLFNYDAQKLPNNETEMAQMIWDQADLGPMYDLPVTFINAPATIVNGVHKRPTTIDTIIAWNKQTNLKPQSTILGISSQPDICRQDLILKQTLRACLIETVGPCNNKVKLPRYFDAIARHLYALLTATIETQ